MGKQAEATTKVLAARGTFEDKAEAWGQGSEPAKDLATSLTDAELSHALWQQAKMHNEDSVEAAMLLEASWRLVRELLS